MTQQERPTEADLARKLRVLVVEDEPRLRELMVDMLPKMHYPATAARSAEEAKRIMEADAHDIILLDLQLPLMSGMEFFEIVRQRWPATQVIILTGYGDLESARAAIRMDVVDFLAKPCHLRDLELALDRARRRVAAVTGAAAPAAEPQAEEAADAVDQRTLADNERQQILATLARHEGNRTAAAAELGISRRTLHYRLSEYKRMGWVE